MNNNIAAVITLVFSILGGVKIYKELKFNKDKYDKGTYIFVVFGFLVIVFVGIVSSVYLFLKL